MYDIEELNDIQKRAVLETEGAVLVTAGAGSGKTRLLTHRIAHLIKDCGVMPYNILAITFTNKAADEMRSRLYAMLGADADGIWIFTFHAACVRILRSFADKIGYGRNFTIYGETETKSVVKNICKARELGDEVVKRMISAISDAKSHGIAPDDYESVYKFSADSEDIAAVYGEYQRVLKSNNAFDYDDLLILTYKLLRTDEEARTRYADKFRYIHIDEFQDTNVIQYDIVKLLASKHGNVFAVGDEDQCIYTWRGASIANIFDFQRDFNCKVFKLEQNYRSTTNILSVANRIIKGNTQRLEKRLWTQNGDGDKVVCFCSATEGFEADYVVRTIHELVMYGKYSYSDCAVLMRLNALTRPFEERFLQYGIPHRVYGGFKFYDRKEVKDVLAYARLAVNPKDDEALYRIINFPRRGIGDASIEKLRAYTASHGMSVYELITGDELPFNGALNAKLKLLGATLRSLREMSGGNAVGFFKYLLFDVLDIDSVFADDSEGDARLENLNELLNSVGEFVKNNPDGDVNDYLNIVSLYSDTDEMNGDDTVTLATVHSAKGLEFPVVFVVGLEDGIFPSMRQSEYDVSAHMEEERRLMYVAVTRAKERLFLTYAKSRFLYGETRYGIPSRFLTEAGLIDKPAERTDNEGYYRGVGAVARATAKSAYSAPEETYGGEKFSGTYKSSYGKTEKLVPTGGDKGIYEGATVMHKRLGKGRVVGLEKLGDNIYAKIDFERGGVMQLAVGFAPITVVEE